MLPSEDLEALNIPYIHQMPPNCGVISILPEVNIAYYVLMEEHSNHFAISHTGTVFLRKPLYVNEFLYEDKNKTTLYTVIDPTSIVSPILVNNRAVIAFYHPINPNIFYQEYLDVLMLKYFCGLEYLKDYTYILHLDNNPLNNHINNLEAYTK